MSLDRPDCVKCGDMATCGALCRKCYDSWFKFVTDFREKENKAKKPHEDINAVWELWIKIKKREPFVFR